MLEDEVSGVVYSHDSSNDGERGLHDLEDDVEW